MKITGDADDEPRYNALPKKSEGLMRYVVDLAVFVGVFLLGALVFQSAFYALLAALIVAGAAEALFGPSFKR